MGKKPMEALFAAAIAFALTACSIAANHGGLDQAAPGQTKESGIRLVNGRIEADAALKAAAQAYEDETGIPVEIESMGGGVEIQDVLKGRDGSPRSNSACASVLLHSLPSPFSLLPSHHLTISTLNPQSNTMSLTGLPAGIMG